MYQCGMLYYDSGLLSTLWRSHKGVSWTWSLVQIRQSRVRSALLECTQLAFVGAPDSNIVRRQSLVHIFSFS